MKLMATMMVSLDGVYQGPGGPDEDRRGQMPKGVTILTYRPAGPATFATMG
jgi:hypothetical protein